MQNKGLVKLFAILFGLVSIYQLSFTFKANRLKTKMPLYMQKAIVEKERQVSRFNC